LKCHLAKPAALYHPVTVSLRPRDGETLAQFFDRALSVRGTNAHQLARRLGDGIEERKFRRWISGETPTMQLKSALQVGRALDADFTPFTRRASVADLLSLALERLDELDGRVQVLEREQGGA